MKKRILSLLAGAFLAFGTISGSNFAKKTATEVGAANAYTEKIYWGIDSHGTLKIGTTEYTDSFNGYVLGNSSANPSWRDSQTKRDLIFKVKFEQPIIPSSCSQWFESCTNLASVEGITNLDTSLCSNLSRMFFQCYSLTSLDLSSLKTSSVTSVSTMFYNCSKLTTLNINGWDTKNITNMASMVHGCSKLAAIDVSGFNTSQVTATDSMFRSCSTLTTLDLSSWDLTKCTSAQNMLDMTTGITTIKTPKNLAIDVSVPGGFGHEKEWYDQNGTALNSLLLPKNNPNSLSLHLDKYTVSFDSNGGSGYMSAVKVGVNKLGDTVYTLPTCTLTAPTNKKFAGWSLDGATIIRTNTITLSADTRLKAVYTCNIHTNIEEVPGKASTYLTEGYKDAYRCTSCGGYFEDEEGTVVIPDYEAWKVGEGKQNRLVYTPNIVDKSGASVNSGETTYQISVVNGIPTLNIYGNELTLIGECPIPVSLLIETNGTDMIFALKNATLNADIDGSLFSALNDSKIIIVGNCIINNPNEGDSAKDLHFAGKLQFVSDGVNEGTLTFNTFNAKFDTSCLIINDEKVTVKATYFFVPTLIINAGSLIIGGDDYGAFGCCSFVMNGGTCYVNFMPGSGVIIADDKDITNKGKMILNGGHLEMKTTRAPLTVFAFCGIEVADNLEIYGSTNDDDDIKGSVIEYNYSDTDGYTFGVNDEPFVSIDVSLHVHNLAFVEGKDATCAKNGYKDAYECTGCQTYFEDEHGLILIGDQSDYDAWKLNEGKIPTINHRLSLVEGNDPTCDTDGYKDAYCCSKCGTYFEDEAGTKVIGNKAAYDAWKLNEGKLPMLPKSGLSAGAIVGIVLGCVFFLILVAFIVLYVLWKKKDKKPLNFLVGIFRKINKSLFKTSLNDIEKKDADGKNLDDKAYLQNKK